MQLRCAAVLLAVTTLWSTPSDAPAVNLVIDYTYDSSDFFGAGNPDGNGSAARDALEAAAGFFSGVLTDTLSAIVVPNQYVGSFSTLDWTWDHVFPDPGGAGFVAITDDNISVDEYRVYVGAESLSGDTAAAGGPGSFSWSTIQNGPGFTPGELAEINVITDAFEDAVENREKPSGFANWGGALTFDNDGSTSWHYDRNMTVTSGKIDFYSVALHEFGHSLGLNGSVDEWNALQVGAEFQGPAALEAWKMEDPDANMSATGVPTESAADHHWMDNNSTSLEPSVESYIVGTTTLQEVAMDPSIITGTRKLFTNVDTLALRDIGWDVLLPVLGDMNGDGNVTTADSAWLITALVDPAAYAAAFPSLDPDMLGDIDGSGTFDLGDVGPFSALLGGPSSAAAVPEPGAALMALIATAAGLASSRPNRGRRRRH